MSWLRRGGVALLLVSWAQACAGRSIDDAGSGGSGTRAGSGSGGTYPADCFRQPCDFARCPCSQPPHGFGGSVSSGGGAGGGGSSGATAPGGEGGRTPVGAGGAGGAAGEGPESAGAAGAPVIGDCTLQSISPDPALVSNTCEATFLCDGGREITLLCDGEGDGTSLCGCDEGDRRVFLNDAVPGEAPDSCYAAAVPCLAALSG